MITMTLIYPKDYVFGCKKGEEQVPYLLIYKKGTNIQANTSVSVNEASYNDVPSNDNKFIDEPGLVDFSIYDDNVNSGKKRRIY